MKRNLWLPAMLAAVLLSAAQVGADDGFYVIAGGRVGTPITSLPLEINNPGFYYLTGNLSYSGAGNGITVNIDNVTIDLMGFCLTGNSSNYGIYMNAQKNLEIRNGTLTSWFNGITTSVGFNHRVVNMRGDGNTNAISLNGSALLVRGCTFSNNSIGIYVSGAATIIGNSLYNNGNAGIYLNTGSATISNNSIAFAGIGIRLNGAGSIIGNTVIAGSGKKGIQLDGTSNDYVMLDQNTVSGDGTHFTGGSASYIKRTNAGF